MLGAVMEFPHDVVDLITAYQPKLIRFLLKSRCSFEDAEEFAQEAICRVLDKLTNQPDQEIEHIRAYLRKTALNLLRMQKRSYAERQRDRCDDIVGLLDSLKTQPASQHDGAYGKEVLAFLGEAKPKARHAAYLRFVEDLSLGDIAEMTGDSEDTINTRLNRVRNIIKQRTLPPARAVTL